MNNKTEVISGQTFVGVQVQVDSGVVYRDCTFRKCRILVAGTGPLMLERVELQDCSFTLVGPAASTLSFLRLVGSWPGGKDQVLKMLQLVADTSPGGPPEGGSQTVH